MKLIPKKRFKNLRFKKGYARIIDIPMKWRTPNIMNSWGIKIHVTTVINSPNENIFKPLLKYFLNKIPSPLIWALVLLSVNETPIKNMNVNAVMRAKNHKNPEFASKGIIPKKVRSKIKW